MQIGAVEVAVGLIYMGITTVISMIALTRAIFGTDRDRLVEYLKQKLSDAEGDIKKLQQESADQRAQIAALQQLPFAQLSDLGEKLAAGAQEQHKQILSKLDFISDLHAGAVEMGRLIAEKGG